MLAKSDTPGRAFTLLELLIVLSIASLIASIAIPGLSRARRNGQSAVCLSNLRQLAAGCAAYSQADANSHILPAHPVADIDTLHHDGEYDYGGATGRSAGWGGTYGPNGPRTAGTRPLNRVLLGDVGPSSDFGVFRCPADPGSAQRWPAENWWWTPDLARMPFFEAVGNSYLGNALRDHEWDNHWLKPPVRIVGVFLRPASRVPAPADTMLLAEANLRIWRQGIYVERARYGIEASAGWHAPGITRNLAYVDGHAAAVTFEEEFPEGNWQADPDGYMYQVRFGTTRFDCRPEPVIEDKPAASSRPGSRSAKVMEP